MMKYNSAESHLEWCQYCVFYSSIL